MRSTVDWSKLPERFEYLRPTAEEYDAWLKEVHKYKDRAAMDSLTPPQIGRLADLYEEIDRRGDTERISIWLKGIPLDERRDERGVYWPIFNLFWVFDDLGKRQVHPFSSKRVEYCPPKRPLDWSTLPANLQYLIEPAEKFGEYWGDGVDEFIENGSEEDKQELAALSERIRMSGDAAEIFAWVKKYYGVEHMEAAAVAEMVNLMYEMGVPIED
jgi:hypothetical protein